MKNNKYIEDLEDKINSNDKNINLISIVEPSEIISVEDYRIELKQERINNNRDYDIYSLKELDDMLSNIKERLNNYERTTVSVLVKLILQSQDIREAMNNIMLKGFTDEVV